MKKYFYHLKHSFEVCIGQLLQTLVEDGGFKDAEQRKNQISNMSDCNPRVRGMGSSGRLTEINLSSPGVSTLTLPKNHICWQISGQISWAWHGRCRGVGGAVEQQFLSQLNSKVESWIEWGRAQYARSGLFVGLSTDPGQGLQGAISCFVILHFWHGAKQEKSLKHISFLEVKNNCLAVREGRGWLWPLVVSGFSFARWTIVQCVHIFFEVHYFDF